MMKMKLLTMFLVLILTGCFEVGAPILIQDNMANRYASTALNELSRTVRGEISVETVDWMCGYLNVTDNFEEFEYQYQVCYYFVEYLSGKSSTTKYARLFFGGYYNQDGVLFESVDTVYFDSVAVEIFETSIELDKIYTETTNHIRIKFENFKYRNTFYGLDTFTIEGNVYVRFEYGNSIRQWGSLSSVEINSAVRNLD